VAAAKKEGAVTLINPLFSDETAARLGPVDVHMVSAPGFFDEAAKRGAFEALDSGHWKDYVALLEKAGQYANYPYVVVPLVYTFQPVWNSSCPGMANVKVDSYADTVQPALKGKTISPDITKSFTYTNTTVSLMESGFDMNAYWDKLKATEPIVEFRTEPKMQMVISCERPFDMWNLSGRVYQNVIKKPELAKVLKIGSHDQAEALVMSDEIIEQLHRGGEPAPRPGGPGHRPGAG